MEHKDRPGPNPRLSRGIAKKGEPGQESRHGSFRDLETKLQQLPMDAGRAPQRVGAGHLPDQGSNLKASLGSTTGLLPGNPGPKETEASPMPGDDGLGFYHDQRTAPILPGLTEQNPKETIGLSQSWSRAVPLEHDELLAEGEILQGHFSNVAGPGEEANQ